MDELLKTLLNSPDKFRSTVIYAIRILLSSVFASWAYENLFGFFTITSLTNFNSWFYFLASGRALLCFLFLWISYIILFQLLEVVSHSIFLYLTGRINKIRGLYKYIGASVTFFLKCTQTLDINRKTGEIKLMEQSDELHEFTIHLTSIEGKKELNEFKSSYLSEIGHTYIIFVLLYFTVMNSIPHHKVINYTVILFLCIIVYACSAIGILVRILRDIAPELNNLIKSAKIEEGIKNIFTQEGLIVHTQKLSNGKNYSCFLYRDNHIVLTFLRSNTNITANIIEKVINEANENKTLSLVFSSMPLTKGIEDDIVKYYERIIFTKVATIEEAIVKSKNLITQNFPEIPMRLFQDTTTIKM